MEFEEALKILGIDVQVGADGARRAYLRLIKVHKPERDPEGFRQLREAYDLVATQIEWRVAVARLTPVPAVIPGAEVPAAVSESPETIEDEPFDEYDLDGFFVQPPSWEDPVAAARGTIETLRSSDTLGMAPSHLLRLLLRLDAVFEGDVASELYDAIVTFNERVGDDRQAFGWAIVQWHLVASYFALRPQMTPDARALVADSLGDLNWPKAAERAEQWNPPGNRGARARTEAKRVLRQNKDLRGILFPTRIPPALRKFVPGPAVWGALRIAAAAAFIIWRAVSHTSWREVDNRNFPAAEQCTNQYVQEIRLHLLSGECHAAKIFTARLAEDGAQLRSKDVQDALHELKPVARQVCPDLVFPEAH